MLLTIAVILDRTKNPENAWRRRNSWKLEIYVPRKICLPKVNGLGFIDNFLPDTGERMTPRERVSGRNVAA